jgi:hypothetical protein
MNKIKLIKIFTILFLLPSFISSCIQKIEAPQAKPAIENSSELPDWVLNPQSDEGVTAVGIAAKSRGGIQFQIPKAELNGKSNIASIIQSKISRLTKNSLRSASVNDNEDIEDFFAQATKEVVKDLPLSGIKRINLHQGKDGTLYVQMLLTNKDYTSFIANGQKTFESMLKQSNIGQGNINKSQEASKALFDELANEK